MSVEHRVAVVTGASNGIGRVVTRRLLAQGYRVAAIGRRLEPLEESLGGSALGLALTADVRDPTAVECAFDAIVSQWSRVDLLFNNAGVFGEHASPQETTSDGWTDTWGTNVSGAFYCARAAIRQMQSQNPRGGRIINNGSVSAFSPRPKSVSYTTTKHAMSGLTKAISLDTRGLDIACGQINIGNASTSIFDDLGTDEFREPTFSAEHVADAVLFMAGLPLGVNVLEMTILANDMPFIGRG
ncbi:SDR family oxidoreductase [Nocardia sp. NPDC049707]|uniref:SDR family oxidoreductase n=1 Tax=Nocardia sp. NPDC049707 TaxID=3154735 RepID=UPI003419C131